MKKASIFIVGLLMFIVCINGVKATPVDGDDVYHFDFTQNSKNVNINNGGNYYDYASTMCLKDYFDNNSDGYELAYDSINNIYNFKKDSKRLFNTGTTSLILEKAPDLDNNDNFVADISDIDTTFCRTMNRYGFNEIAVYFESEDEIPVFNDFVFDFTTLPDPMSLIFEEDEYMLEQMVMYALFYMKSDDITPDLSLDSPPSLPLIMSVNDKEFFELYVDDITHEKEGRLLNEDDLTIADNQVYSKEDIITEFSKPEYADIRDAIIMYLGMFDNIRIIVSHNDVLYTVIDGDGQTINLDEDFTLKFEFSTILNEFLESGEIYIDGELVDTDNYVATEGSTIITIISDFIKTLGIGEHEVTLMTDYGEITATYTAIKSGEEEQDPKDEEEKEIPDYTEDEITPTDGSDKSSIDEKSSNPKTGDNIINYMIMMFLSLVGIIGMKLYKRN